MLVYGRFEDQDGVKYHIPVLFQPADPEREIVQAARRIAYSKGVCVVRVWGVYETERELR